MTYKRGDIVLVKFPKNTQSNLCPIDAADIINGDLSIKSYVKYDKCFTLNSGLVDKKLASVNDGLMEK